MNYWLRPFKYDKSHTHVTRKNLALEAILKILTGMANLTFELDMWILQKRLGLLDPRYNKNGTRKK